MRIAILVTPMTDIKTGEADLLAYLKPGTLVGALVYLVLFLVIAILISRGLRALIHAAMTREGNFDRTTLSFLQQFGAALTWVMMLILYAHLIPDLRAMGTALLASVSVASVVLGLAAQSTLGNLVAGLSITIYKPFRLGDTLQVTAPTGTEIGVVETISLGNTTLRAADGRGVVLPNSLAANQVTINLSRATVVHRVSVQIHTARDNDLESARKLARAAVKEVDGCAKVESCAVARIDAAEAVLDLRVALSAGAAADEVRSRLIERLASDFTPQDARRPNGPRTTFS